MDNTKMNQHWTSDVEVTLLRDKKGNPLPPDECKKYTNILQNIDRDLLFPCSRSPDKLEMKKKVDSDAVPREMNRYMVFRRQLALVLREKGLSDDGKILSRIASYIWNRASEDEKGNYARIAEELKRRHLERYPNYTYERRNKRKTPEGDFIHVHVNTEGKKKRKVLTPQTRVKSESNPVERNFAPASTSLAQEQEKGWSYNSLTIPTSDNSLDMLIQESYQTYGGIESYNNYPEESCDNYQVHDENIPLVVNNIVSQNYMNVSPQQLQIQQPQLPQLSPPSYCNYFIEGGQSGIGDPYGDLLEQFLNINTQ